MSGQNNKTMTNIFTIGFAKKSACEFFTKLMDAGIKTVIDVRLNNVSQLILWLITTTLVCIVR